MHSVLLQPWTTISSQLSQFTQDEGLWADLESYSDIAGLWIDVTQVIGTGVQLLFQTSPSHDEAYFQPLMPAAATPLSVGSVVVKPLRNSTTVALARWVRWQLTGPVGPTPWGVTFRVRAVLSKQPLFQPTDLPGCVLWLRADFALSLNAGTPQTVNSWTDLSGTGYVVSQGTPANQPLYFPNGGGPTGVPELDFGGTTLLENTANDLLTTSGQARTILVAGVSASITGGTLACFRRSTSGGTSICVADYFATGGNTYVYTDGVNGANNATVPGTAIPTGVPFVLDWELSATAGGIAFALNGTPQTVTQPSGNGMTAETSTAHGFTVGARDDVSQPWPGAINELIVYNRVLTTKELIANRRYLGSRYGVTVP